MPSPRCAAQELVLAAGLLLALTACLNLGGQKGPPTETFLLNPELPSTPRDGATRPKAPTLVVSIPVARPGYDTARMVYSQRPHEIRYYAYHEWADPPARMLQPLVVRALEPGGCWSAVIPAPAPVQADYRLDLDALMLNQDFLQKPSRTHLELDARLVNLDTQEVTGSRHFEVSAPASSENAYGGVSAANRATGALLEQLRTWLSQQVGCDVAPVASESSR